MRKLDYPSHIGNIYIMDEELTAIGVAAFGGIHPADGSTPLLTLAAGWKAHTITSTATNTNGGS